MLVDSKDDVTADGRHRGVFADLDDAVGPAGAGTEHLEDDNDTRDGQRLAVQL